MPDVFLSYSREDQPTARQVAEAFGRAGFSVWWDQSLRSGEAFDRVTEKALEDSKAVVVLWSKASVESRWVRAEATQADQGSKLVPVMIEPCKRPIMFELTHTADLCGWHGEDSDPRWRALVGDLRSLTGQSSNATSAPALQMTGKPPTKKTALLGLALLAVIALLIGIWFIFGRDAAPTTLSASLQGVSVDSREPVTLAVLPFVNLSSDPEQEYFSDGLTEEILNQLAQVRRLRVTGRTSSFSFKGKNEDLRQIGRQLDVGHLLEGSVRKDGNTLRITAQLIDATNGAHLWSKTYDRELSKVFVMQEELAKDVAATLSIALDVGELTRAQGGTTDVAAYERYLLALEQGGNRTGIQKAQLLREAVALDPQFALAWYRLYSSLRAIANFQSAAEAAVSLKERAQIGARLEQLLPREGNLARLYRADRAFDERRWAEVFVELEAVQAHTPDDTEVNGKITIALRAVGRAADSIPYLRRAQQADPLQFGGSEQLMRTLRLLGRHEEADALAASFAPGQINPTEQLYRDVWYPAVRPGPKAPWEEVSARLRTFGERVPPENDTRALFLGAGSHPDDVRAARAMLRKEFGRPRSEGQLSLLAFLADQAGDRELTIEILRRSYVDMHGGWLPNLWERTVASGAREDPAFKALLRDLKIADYWRASGNWGDFCKPVGETDFECH